MQRVDWTVLSAVCAISLVGCGSSGGHSSSGGGPTAKFNACIGRTAAGLSASGHPVADGATEPIVDQLHGVAGNVWLYKSHSEAEANAKVMTGYPIRIVRGSYMVDVNPGTGSDDKLAIQACASGISRR